MPELPTEWSNLCALVFLLGLKHGFDADHLAIIDGLTRHNGRHRRPFARYCGALFSLGHGAVVLLIAVGVSTARARWATPVWLESGGAWASIAFLTAIGIVNLRAVLSAGPEEVMKPVGIKGRYLGQLATASRPLSVALVGAVFAVSFDTVSQSALFALTALHFGGVGHAILLALLFAAGMIATDAINGVWISRLIARADQIAVIASRVMSLAVSGVSLLVAGYGAAGLLVPVIARWSQDSDLLAGAVVCALMAGSYLCARMLARLDQAGRAMRGAG